MEHPKKICRLCLRKSHTDIDKNININTEKCLNILLLKINLDVSEEPMVCTNCAIVLQKCYDFKTTCLATKKYTCAFDNKDDAKLDLKDVYLSTNENRNVDWITHECNVCCFCMGLINNCPFISLENEKGDAMLVRTMLEKCLPELDINIIKKPTVCVPCRGYLEDYFRFMTNCTNVEETIKKCCESVGTNSKGQIELIDVLKFSLKTILKEGDTIKKHHKNTHFVKIKDEKLNTEEFQLENNFISKGVKKLEATEVEGRFYKAAAEIVKAEVDNKHENILKVEDQKFNNGLQSTCNEDEFSIKTEQEFWEDGEIEVEPSTGDFIKPEDLEFLPCGNEEIDIKTDQHDFNSSPDGVLPQLSTSYDAPNATDKNVSDVKMHHCTSCAYQTNKKSNLKLHLLVHKNPSEVPVHKCGSCSYQSKNKNYLRKHLLVHRDPSQIKMYKCDVCSYQAKQINHLRKHSMVHKDPLDTTMYKCETCSFQTKYKKALNVHNIVHKNPADVTMYQCGSCSFKTIHKRSLHGHMLTHRDSSETTMYRCDSCPFQTKHKKSLHWHNITHQNPSEVPIYKCESCSYQSKNKHYLTRHLLVHKDPLEINMHRCKSCPFQARTSANLRNHLLVHRDPSEVTMHKCEICSYQTKIGSNLRRHLLVHKDPSDITIYECQFCSFQTKHKKALTMHNVTHKNTSDIMYQCHSCSFTTEYKIGLHGHMLTHRDPLETTIYKCEFCAYQTKFSFNLQRHLLVHKDLSEITMYKCRSCSFQAKHRKGLQRHMLGHKGTSNNKNGASVM